VTSPNEAVTSPDEPVTDEAGPDRDAVAARRVLVLLVVAVAAALVAGVLLLARGDDPSTVDVDAAGVVDHIGPTAGQAVDAAMVAAESNLVEASGRRPAVVSLTDYEAASAVRELVEADGLEVRSFLVAVPGGIAGATDDPKAFRSAQLAEAESQIAEIEPLIPTVDDPEFVAFYEEEVERYHQMLDRIDAPLVFGALVEGAAGDLRAVASRDRVRAVFVGGAGRLTDDTEVRGLRPEETEEIGRPEFRPL